MTGLAVTQPGMYSMPEADYHADPVPGGSLSCSGAKLLLPPGHPARFDWVRKHPEDGPRSRAMEFGTAAHREVLGTGWAYAVSPHGDDWRSRKAQDWAAGKRAEGVTPLLPAEREQIVAMAAAITTNPDARLMLQADEVWHEQSLFWVDDDTGIWRRARLDAVKLYGRVLIIDYKSAKSADPEQFAKDVGNYRYHWQHAWYTEAVLHVTGDMDPAFCFVVQEKDPPYAVGIYELDLDAVLAGAERCAAACRKYADCVAAGAWPGPQPAGDRITKISLPRWAY